MAVPSKRASLDHIEPKVNYILEVLFKQRSVIAKLDAILWHWPGAGERSTGGNE
jgi:hypothetical protein